MRHFIVQYGTFVILLFAFTTKGQDDIYKLHNIYRNPFRVFLNNFTATITTGYAVTKYSHTLSGVYFYQDATQQLIFSNNIENLGNPFIGYQNWLNDPTTVSINNQGSTSKVPYDYLQNPVYNPLLQNEQLLVDTDTASIGFKGISHGVPINLRLHFNLKELYRIGGGFSYEIQSLTPLEPTLFENQVRKYRPNNSSTSYTRLYGMVGYKFYRFWWYDFFAELEIGQINAGNAFNPSMVTRGTYTNFGISIENIWSEYFRLIIKPSVEFKSYSIMLEDGATIKHSYPTYQLQFGVGIRFPDIPRSPIKNDYTQVKHIYRNPQTGRKKEVRGQPIWKRQNPKIGENNKIPLRYKGKNKKKLNPF